MSYSQELKQLRETRRKVFALGFSFFVVLPTLLAIIYYGFIATPLYTSTSKFTVTVEGGASAGSLLDGGNVASMFASSGGALAIMQESQVIKSYLTSQDVVETLEKNIGLYKIFDAKHADFLSKPPENPKIEKFTDYYRKMVKVRLDEMSGVMTLEVDAFSPDDAKTISEAILKITEDFVNKRSDRMQKDSVSFAENFLKESEQEVIKANSNLTKFRNQNKNFDPMVTATGVLGITSQLEAELAKTQTEITTLSNFLKEDNSRLQALEAKARSLKEQIDKQSGRLASQSGSKLATIAQQYEALKLLAEFSVKRYGMALTGFEKARVMAAKQKKYLVRVVGPTFSQQSLKPNTLYEILGTFFVSLVTYIIGGLIISALRDHIRI